MSLQQTHRAAALVLLFAGSLQAATWFVDADAPGPADGLSWSTAFLTPQDALLVAGSGDTIRVAQGIYLPDGGRIGDGGYVAGSGDREASFQLISGVALEGGYAGFGEPEPGLRNIGVHLAILSGDLDNNDNPVSGAAGLLSDATRSENSRHMLTGSGTDASAILDGFTVTAGRANGSANNGRGGGMLNDGGSPTVRSCAFSANTAEGPAAAGGGMHNRNSSLPTIIDCVFATNASAGNGGGMSNRVDSDAVVTSCMFLGNHAGADGGGMGNNNDSAPRITNSLFSGNFAESNGGAIVTLDTVSPIIINCTFSRNAANGDGGGMWYEDGALTVTNCIFWGNADDADGSAGGPLTDGSAQVHTGGSGSATVTYCCVQDNDPNDGSIPFNGAVNQNIDDDPLFGDADGADNIAGTLDDDLRPQASVSPCIDAGRNNSIPAGILTDLDGNPRRVNDPQVTDTGNPGTAGPPIVDLGAYEQRDCDNDGVFDGSDTDGDGVSDVCDVCPLDHPDDTDGDGVCDSDDLCPGFDDTTDGDGDGVADGCDPCPLDNPDDTDSDGACDSDDLCPGFDDNADGDGDGVADGCDPCPLDNPDDTDSDGICDSDDLCPGFDDNADGDGDGVADGCDPCPLDNPDDSDNDGACDSDDLCPGFDDNADGDGDGVPDACDPCPSDNPDDSDGDGICESEDVCPGLDDRTGCAPPAGVICVRAGAPGMNDGTNWYNAYNNLRTALADPNLGITISEIWVAAGTYMPDGGVIPVGGAFVAGVGGRAKTFVLINNVGLYGGFAGTETQRDQRDPDANATILSGDINGDGDPAGNSYHVVTGSGTDSTAVLDGFTVTAGNASDFFSNQNKGGGMFNLNGSPTVIRCSFTGNRTGGGFSSGGGMYNADHSSPTLTACVFNGNTAGERGGGMYNTDQSSPTLNDCEFTGNYAPKEGGGMYNTNYSSPTVAACLFNGNTAGERGGGMYSTNQSSPTLIDCEFTGNSAPQQGGGVYCLGGRHTLVDVTFTVNVVSGNNARGGAFYGSGIELLATGCSFIDNMAPNGNSDAGGMYINGSATLTNCRFIGNLARDEGGGLFIDGGSGQRVTNCLFSGNTAQLRGGGGIINFVDGTAITNGTFSHNVAGDDGGGLESVIGGAAMVTNCIFRGNSDSGGTSASAQIDGPAAVHFSNVQGGWSGAGTNNINADPLFVDADGADDAFGTLDDDLSLLPGSPCIDAGDQSVLAADFIPDLAGNPRIADDPATANTGDCLDMGAYEFPAPGSDGDGDGVPDTCDLCPGTLPGALVDGDGCTPVIAADFDHDGDVDADDVNAFAACASGPSVDLAPGCEDMDFDTDADADQTDFAVVQRCFSGENVAGDPNCAP